MASEFFPLAFLLVRYNAFIAASDALFDECARAHLAFTPPLHTCLPTPPSSHLDFTPPLHRYDEDGGGSIGYSEYVMLTLRDALARSGSRAIDLFRSLCTGHGQHAGTIEAKEQRAVDMDERFAVYKKPPPPGIKRADFQRGIASMGFEVRAEEIPV